MDQPKRPSFKGWVYESNDFMRCGRVAAIAVLCVPFYLCSVFSLAIQFCVEAEFVFQ